MSADTQYAYAVARVRATEKKLLDRTHFDRMIDSKTADDALKILIEADYGDSGSEISNAFEYEKLLKEEGKKTYRFLKEIAPEPQVFDLFLIRNDYHNAKVILKSEFLGYDNDSILVDTGSIPPAKLKIMIRDRKMSDITDIMRRAIEESIDTYNKTSDPQVVDIIMDRAAYKQMSGMAEKTENQFLTGLVRIMIDLVNINVFLRVKFLGKPWDFLQKILLPGGSLDNSIFIKSLQDTLEAFAGTLRFTIYGMVVEEGIISYQTTGNLTKLEKLFDNFVMEFIKKSKYTFFGIEPLIGYLVGKETEIRNARIAMVGKINNISSDTIKERLRETYV